MAWSKPAGAMFSSLKKNGPGVVQDMANKVATSRTMQKLQVVQQSIGAEVQVGETLNPKP